MVTQPQLDTCEQMQHFLTFAHFSTCARACVCVCVCTCVYLYGHYFFSQAEVLRFINTVVQTAVEPNAKVFHQQEFIDAGLSVQEIREVRK